MAFCNQCGNQLTRGSRFCANCGAPVGKVEPKHTVQREIVYEGNLHKCPNCGEVLKSFTSKCPSCGLELRGTKGTRSVREFAQKLEAIEAMRETKKSRSLKDRMYGEQITKTDEQKINLIRSFAIPNTKEDLYEFLILAKSNIDVDLYDGTVQKNDARIAVSNAWKAKFEQAYQKAMLIFEGDPAFDNIQKLYDQTHKEIKKSKGKQWRLVAYIYGALIAVFVVIFASIAIASPSVEKKELARLESLVSEIENQLDAEQYELALMNAEALDYDGAIRNDEQIHKWKIQKAYWIDKIINEAATNGVYLEYTPAVDDGASTEEGA